MLRKLLLSIVACISMIGVAFADVDVNKADQAALDGIKGVGPSTSKRILEERKQRGHFKDWTDLQTRVKGIGDKSATKLSEAGLTVGGASKPAAATAKAEPPKKAKDQKMRDQKSDASSGAVPTFAAVPAKK
jgi:competence protein ComEA